MEPLYLVDGSGYIFRAFFAVAPLSNKNGLPTNALFGFVRMITKLLREMDAKYIAITFDTGQPTFRHEVYEEYKANREECPKELVPQMPYFRKIVEAFGIRCLEKVGVEADDIIATLSSVFAERKQDVVVVSGDKDLLQLVGDRVKVYDAMRDVYFNREGVKSKLGVYPEQVRDYLALMGDSSDNVPGIRGVGPKSAERLIESFGSVEEILKNPAAIETLAGLRGAKSIREKVESGSEMLRLSYLLVGLLRDVEPYKAAESVEEFAFREVNSDLLVPLFEELEFTSLLSSLEFAGASSKKTAAPELKKNFQIVTKEHFESFCEALSQHTSFAFDTETTSLDVLSCELMGISFSWMEGEGYYVPLKDSTTPGEALDLVYARSKLEPIFANPEVAKVGLNLKYDIGVLEQHGFRVNGETLDVMLAAHLLHPDRRQTGLKFLTEQYLREKMVTYEELLAGKEKIEEVPLTDLAHYAAHDAEASWRLYQLFAPLLLNQDAEAADSAVHSLRNAFDQIECPLVPVLSRMERNGIKIDVPFLESLGQEFSSSLSSLESQIHALAGKTFNINSPKQLGVVLFEDLKLPTSGVKKKQSGYSTDASVLTLLSESHEIAGRLLEYRELHKLNSTYVESLKRMLHPQTGRIHTSFNQAIAATGRLSSTEPNLQNIPIRNPRGRQLRQAFIADAGQQLLAVDYSQIELRVLAHLSGDKNLRQAFLEGEDIHTRTAKELFGGAMLSEQELKDLRRVAKTINFGIVYGMGAFRLAGDLGVSRKQAQKYIDDYFARYPKVLEYFEKLKKDIETKGYVETLFGRRRYAREIDTSGRDAGYTERSLLNAPIQGTAAEIIKRAMIDIDAKLRSSASSARMVLQVHDELVFEIPDPLLDEVRQMVVETMESAVKLDVPLKVDVRSGTRWGE